MTLTVDLTAVEEARLAAAARQEGVAPVALLKKLVNNLPLATELNEAHVSPEQARVAAIRAAQGSMAHIGVTVEDLHRERRTDKHGEEHQAQGRLQ